MPPKDVGQKGVGGSTSSAAATEATKASSLAREGVQKLTMIVATTTPGAESKSRTKGELINLIMGLGATCHQETLSSHQQGLVLGQVVAQLTKNLNVSDPPATPQNPPGGGGGGTPQTVPAGGPMPTPPKPPPRFRWTAPAAGGGSRAGERDANALLTDSKTCAASPPPSRLGAALCARPLPTSHRMRPATRTSALPPFSRTHRMRPATRTPAPPSLAGTYRASSSCSGRRLEQRPWSSRAGARCSRRASARRPIRRRSPPTTSPRSSPRARSASRSARRAQRRCAPPRRPSPCPAPCRAPPATRPSAFPLPIASASSWATLPITSAPSRPPPLTATDSSHRCPRHRAPPAGSRASPRR